MQVSTEWLSHMWDMMRGRLLADAAAAVTNHKDSPEIFCKAVDLLQVTVLGCQLSGTSVVRVWCCIQLQMRVHSCPAS